MAFEAKKIDPLDLQPSIAVGINLPFSSPAVFSSTYQTKDAIRVNLINFMLTNKGERYLNPTFGSNIRLMLFENINQDVIEEVKLRILEEVSIYFPRVSPKKFELSFSPDTHVISFYMKYQIKDSNIEDELLINIEQ